MCRLTLTRSPASLARRNATGGWSDQWTRRACRRRDCVRGVVRIMLAFAGAASAFAAEPFEAVLVRFDVHHRPAISRPGTSVLQLGPGEMGLVVWTEQSGERWQIFRGTWSRPGDPGRNERAWLVSQAANARGSGAASPSALAQLTTQLDPLLSPSVIKALRGPGAAGFLTPPNGGVLLNSRLTIRRLEKAGQGLPRRPGRTVE